jgi:hypothetical protein
VASEEKLPDNILWHQSGVNAKGEPFVQLLKGMEVIAQMDVQEARDHGRAMLEAAEAAETDAFVFDWLQTEVKVPHDRAAMLLVEFRKYREKTTGKQHGPTDKRQWVMPPGEK